MCQLQALPVCSTETVVHTQDLSSPSRCTVMPCRCSQRCTTQTTNCLVAAPTGSGKTAMRGVCCAAHDPEGVPRTRAPLAASTLRPCPASPRSASLTERQGKHPVLTRPTPYTGPFKRPAKNLPAHVNSVTLPAVLTCCIAFSTQHCPMMKGSTEYKRHWSVSTQQTS